MTVILESSKAGAFFASASDFADSSLEAAGLRLRFSAILSKAGITSVTVCCSDLHVTKLGGGCGGFRGGAKSEIAVGSLLGIL